MEIIVGFSKSRSCLAVGSLAIRLAEKRPYSHAFIKHKSPITGEYIVTQASHGSINQQNLNVFLNKNEIIEEYSYEISQEDFKKLLKFIHQNLGKPYSRLQICILTIYKLFKIKVNYQNHDDAFICSEFTARILEVLGLLNTCDEDYITPSDLHKLIGKG